MNALTRVHALIVALAAVAAGVTGCSGESKAACGVVIDLTGYRTFPEPAKTSKMLIDRHLPTFLRECGWLAYAAITGNSEGSPCQEPSRRLEAGTGNSRIDDEARETLVKKALERAEALRNCVDPVKGTDVLGALRVLGDRMAAAPDPSLPRKIVIFSDLGNNRPPLEESACDLTDAQDRARKVAELKQGGFLPDLGPAQLAVYGFNLLEERDPRCVPPLKALWQEIFTAVGVPDAEFL